jgi:nitrite reductase/ring-hydroxylating ferredoxin subunit
MLFEDKSTKCPNCQSPLTLLSHGIRFEKTEIHEFDFRCDKCNRKYEFKNGELAPKPAERDLVSESEALRNIELQHAFNRRCSLCAGPIVNPYGLALRCEWCGQGYSMDDGELQEKNTDQRERRPAMREFYALHEKR